MLGTSFYESNDPTNNVRALKEDRVLRIRLQSHQVHPTTLTIIQQLCGMKQKHTKYTQINTNKSMHSEMGPVWQNPIQRTVRTAHLSVLMTAQLQYTTQHVTVLIISPLTSRLQTNITAQVMSIGGERCCLISSQVAQRYNMMWNIVFESVCRTGFNQWCKNNDWICYTYYNLNGNKHHLPRFKSPHSFFVKFDNSLKLFSRTVIVLNTELSLVFWKSVLLELSTFVKHLNWLHDCYSNCYLTNYHLYLSSSQHLTWVNFVTAKYLVYVKIGALIIWLNSSYWLKTM